MNPIKVNFRVEFVQEDPPGLTDFRGHILNDKELANSPIKDYVPEIDLLRWVDNGTALWFEGELTLDKDQYPYILENNWIFEVDLSEKPTTAFSIVRMILDRVFCASYQWPSIVGEYNLNIGTGTIGGGVGPGGTGGMQAHP